MRALPPTLVVFSILGMCNWMHKWYRAEGRLSPDAIADVFVDLIDDGLLARGRDDTATVAAALRRIDARLAALERRPRGRRR